MIRWPHILQLVGFLSLGLTACLGAPLIIGIAAADQGIFPLLKAMGVTGISGAVLALVFRPVSEELNHREAIFLVVASWIVVSILGGLPFYCSPYFPSFTDAVFESVSGFTTTGASILSDVEALPDSLLFWRHFTQWLGGMGIILLMIAILPLVGTGGLALYRAEFSGARSEKIKARVAETALALWRVYIGFSIAGYVALRGAGMRPLDAACHTFTALSTGGFSTRNISVESFHDLTIEIILVVLMIMGAVNFTLHYRLWVKGEVRRFAKDVEIRFYLPLLGLVWLAVTLDRSASVSLGEAVRQSIFNVTSIMTTTGFSSADFGKWSPFCQLVLLASMYVGGCTGATCGGLKCARVVLLAKVIWRQFRQMVEQRQVIAVRLGSEAWDDATIQSLLNLILLTLMVDFAATLLLTATGVDIVTSISAVAATMFSVGPGLGQVGPASNYGDLPVLAKWTLIFCMMAGRLEFYTFFVIFTRSFWRK